MSSRVGTGLITGDTIVAADATVEDWVALAIIGAEVLPPFTVLRPVFFMRHL